TVVRFAKRLGFRGFQELRVALARELGASGRSTAPRLDGGTAVEILESGPPQQLEAIRHVPATPDLHQFEAAVEALAAARRVLFVGHAHSASLVHHAGFAGRLIGLVVEAPTEGDAQECAAAVLTAEDVCVAFSQTGSSRRTVAVQALARAAGART